MCTCCVTPTHMCKLSAQFAFEQFYANVCSSLLPLKLCLIWQNKMTFCIWKWLVQRLQICLLCKPLTDLKHSNAGLMMSSSLLIWCLPTFLWRPNGILRQLLFLRCVVCCLLKWEPVVLQHFYVFITTLEWNCHSKQRKPYKLFSYPKNHVCFYCGPIH